MVVQTLEVLKNHYTNSSAPAVVQSPTNQVHTHPTLLRAFFGFTLPAKPVGETLTSAVLKVTTTTTGDSVDTITINNCGDSWDEATLVWNNQPAIIGPLATIVAPSTISTDYNFSMILAPFIAAAGGNISLASSSVAAAGGDTFVVWSIRQASIPLRPRLTLTFTPDVSYVTSFAALRAAGYTGSLSEMRRQNLLALLSLTEPQAKSNNDLELQYWRSVGKTGSIMDARHQA